MSSRRDVPLNRWRRVILAQWDDGHQDPAPPRWQNSLTDHASSCRRRGHGSHLACQRHRSRRSPPVCSDRSGLISRSRLSNGIFQPPNWPSGLICRRRSWAALAKHLKVAENGERRPTTARYNGKQVEQFWWDQRGVDAVTALLTDALALADDSSVVPFDVGERGSR